MKPKGIKKLGLAFKLEVLGTLSLHSIIKIKWETVKILEKSTHNTRATCNLTLKTLAMRAQAL